MVPRKSGRIDCVEHKREQPALARMNCVPLIPCLPAALCSRFGVRGYPTLMLYASQLSFPVFAFRLHITSAVRFCRSVRNEGGGVHNVYDFSGERDVPGMQAFVQDGGWKSVTPSVFPK